VELVRNERSKGKDLREREVPYGAGKHALIQMKLLHTAEAEFAFRQENRNRNYCVVMIFKCAQTFFYFLKRILLFLFGSKIILSE
jgi:hypothetical protein